MKIVFDHDAVHAALASAPKAPNGKLMDGTAGEKAIRLIKYAGNCFNIGAHPEVRGALGLHNKDQQRGAARVVTADGLSIDDPAFKNALSKCKSTRMADDILDAQGNIGLAVRVLERGLSECLERIGIDVDSQPVVKHILSQVKTFFKVATIETPLAGGLVDDLLVYYTRTAELRIKYAGEIIKLNNLKAGRAAEVVAVPEGTPAKKPEEKKSSTTPGSLDEEATPSEKVINKKLNRVLTIQSEHSSKLGDIFDQGAAGFGAAVEEYKKAESERKAAAADREKREKQRLEEKEAELEKEFAAKKQALKEEKALLQKQAEEKEEDRKALAAVLFQSELRMRSHNKSINNDQTNLIDKMVKDAVANGEGELDETFDKGVAAGVNHQKQVVAAEKSAALNKRFGGSKVKAMTATFERDDAENNSLQTTLLPLNPPRTLPRRSGRTPGGA